MCYSGKICKKFLCMKEKIGIFAFECRFCKYLTVKALKKLTGQTAIYGMPSIVGRFLNWWLVPYWSYVFTNQAQMGGVINMYAYVAFFMVILTYGLETGYFRFASKESNPDKVFSTSQTSLFFTTSIFLIIVLIFNKGIATWMEIGSNPEFVSIMAVTLALDVVSAIPFAKLRLNNRPVRFAILKFINIGINISFNLIFLTLFPFLANKYEFFSSLYNESFGIGYIFLSNLIASAVTFLMLIPELRGKFSFDKELLKRMLKYSLPILVVGITGMINQQIDKILLPRLLPDDVEPMKQLGIYGACFKMAVLLNMFVQAFRFAFEPFFFGQKGGKDSKTMYVIVMKYFVIAGLVMFLGLSTFIDILKLLIAPGYRSGIGIIPIVLMANLFMGIYFVQSLWYKLTDKTQYGAYFGIIGAIITLLVNILLIPVIGYYASALAMLACFTVITVLSYVYGQKYYPITYNLRSFFFYLIVSLALLGLYWEVRTETDSKLWLSVIVNVVFWAIIFFRERKTFKQEANM